MASNGLQKYVDEQANVAGYHSDLMMLKAYNKGVAAALAASELHASYAFPDPTRFPDGFKMKGGGSDGYSVGPGSVDNAEYSSLVTGGCCKCGAGGMSGGVGISGGKKVNRLKKAKKWLDFDLLKDCCSQNCLLPKVFLVRHEHARHCLLLVHC